MHTIVHALTNLGGLAGLAAVITAITTTRRHDDDMRAVRAQVEPNHGTSLRDAVARIEAGQDALREDLSDLSSRLGHEIGEIKRQSDREHADFAARLRHLEH